MKRVFALLLILTMLFSLAACTAQEPQNTNDPPATDETPEIDMDSEIDDDPVTANEGAAAPESQPEISLDDVAPEDSPLKDWDSVLGDLQSAMEGSEGAVHITMDEGGTFTAKEDVASYLHSYGHLPDNFITKAEAQALGWPGGDLSEYAPGKCIGGDRFGNYEGLLPAKDGRTYAECDIDTLGADDRGEKRLVYSNDGLIYYTEDHYETFELLYGEP